MATLAPLEYMLNRARVIGMGCQSKLNLLLNISVLLRLEHRILIHILLLCAWLTTRVLLLMILHLLGLLCSLVVIILHLGLLGN